VRGSQYIVYRGMSPVCQVTEEYTRHGDTLL
jgi:hypothetical protein